MEAIGIDLGTTNSCVGVYKNFDVHILKNKRQDRTTPSVIGFNEGEILIGKEAQRLLRKPYNVISDVKRFIGLPFMDEKVQENIKLDRWPFKIINSNSRINVIVQSNEGNVPYTPEELSGFLIKDLKLNAEQQFNKQIKNVVITVPTHFSDSQRQATIDAGKLAGFDHVKLLNEPTAAAVAYGHYNKITTDSTFLIFDFGGGTFDVSIINLESGIFDVLAIDGELHLGGIDIDNRLLDYFSKQCDFDLTTARKRSRLRAACENLKIELTCSNQATLDLVDEDEIELSRDEFNRINQDLFNETINIVDRCIRRINLSKDDISHIVLVGGSSRIPKISDMLKQYFHKEVKCNINPDEAVAMGAAIVASKKLDLRNICPYSVGVQIMGGKMRKIIEKYTKLPVEISETFQTAKKGQDTINIKIYQGEDEYTKNNKFLGNFIITGISKVPNGVVKETFRINEDGILLVSAVAGEGAKHLKITLESGSLTSSEIEQFKEKLTNNYIFSEDTKHYKKAVDELQQLQEDTNDAERWLPPSKVSPENQKKLNLVISELRNVLLNKVN